jgi:diketogulonate reductase-like aldo/keto reductase
MKSDLPSIGFGTWKLENTADTAEIIRNALQAGYRLIDTASVYGNEEAIGSAIAEASRSGLWVSGKLWNEDRNRVEEACEKTIQNLKCDYLDLYLMHWPASKALHPDWAEINASVWARMESLVQAGIVRYIGVSNFNQTQLEALLPHCSVFPLVNQIELHPGWPQIELTEYCRRSGIAVQAWSPLRSGKLLRKKELISLAEHYGRTPAQIILRWCVQRGVIPIVKSTNPQRMRSNLDLDFSLSEADMNDLTSLSNLGWSGLDSETLTLFG